MMQYVSIHPAFLYDGETATVTGNVMMLPMPPAAMLNGIPI
jgi:hypothetical protein